MKRLCAWPVVVFALMSVGTTCGCAHLKRPTASELAARYDGTVSYGELKRHSDWLYELSVMSYDYDRIHLGEERLRKVSRLLCSGCRVGRYHGRNFDWIDDGTVEYILRTPAQDGRHATLGVSSPLDCGLGTCAAPDTPSEWGILPFFTMDGINDAGLVAQVNYVPAGDCGWTKGTNPGKPQLTFVVIVRYLLDYAGSVEEAIRLLEEHDVWGVASFECHFLVSDPKESAVIEFVDNRMKVLRGERVLTNFYLERFRESGRHTPHAVGIERYAELKDGLDGVTSADGMVAHLKKAWYSRTYLPGGEMTWPSEMNGDCSKEGFGDVTLDTPLAERRKVFDWYRRRIAEHGANTGHAWHTKHTSVYDIEARSLRITMREDVGETFEFALADGNPLRQGGAR